MVTIAQCRAARGLLGWTQQELADASGLSKTAINNFEKGHSDMKAESLKAIRTAFETRDIEFTGTQGLRIREDRAEILKGDDALALLLDDVMRDLKNNDGEFLITAPSHNSFWQDQEKTLSQHLSRLDKKKTRILCSAGDAALWDKLGDCRQINPRHESSMVSFCYGSKVALMLWQEKAIVILSNPAAASAEAARFELLWGSAEDTSHSKTRTRA
jgi:transcriptional regulator with XRE-family HTH domain